MKGHAILETLKALITHALVKIDDTIIIFLIPDCSNLIPTLTIIENKIKKSINGIASSLNK